jgi:hypothetical protein
MNATRTRLRDSWIVLWSGWRQGRQTVFVRGGAAILCGEGIDTAPAPGHRAGHRRISRESNLLFKQLPGLKVQ